MERIEMSIVCQFDQTMHSSLEEFHAYLRRFKISQKVYYTTYAKKVDKLTGEPIPFKDREQYLIAEFASKTNLKKWLSQNKEEGLRWSKDWLVNRKRQKGLIYAPSQVELRTLMCPSIPYYNSVGSGEGGYEGITKSIGLQSRYTHYDIVLSCLPADSIILQDSREQKPLQLSRNVRLEALDVGDYALATPYDIGIRIERKSLSDFCGSLSGRKTAYQNKKKATRIDSSLERLDRELTRAQEANLYVIMVVESDINEAQSFNYLPHMKHIKASPSYIFKNLRDLLVKYPLNFQVLFVSGRVEMAEKIIKIFQLGDNVKKIDLQLAYEQGRI